jgi:biotin-(acetyl-CoA carboxylase) ligase
LLEVLGAEVDLKAVRDQVLDAFDRIFSRWQEGGDQEILRRVAPVLTTVGSDVEFKKPGLRAQRGVALELSDSGFLLVKVGRSVVELRAERVEWLRERS